jgi:glyoxylase-like metal-dependent hydrolase (beta-lactamase superfamily II)
VAEGIRLYLFEGGMITLPLRNFIMGRGLEGEMISTPVIWFLITHPRGNVVIDGGNAAEAAVDAKKHWGAFSDLATLEMTPEQAVVPALVAHGFDPASVRWIVQSHLHLDHTGAVAALDSFPNAEVLVTRTEHEFAHAPDSYSSIGYCQADYVKPGVRWVMLEDSDDGFDLYRDGTLRCWRTPGHSPGHQSFEVRLPSGASYLLTFDAAFSLVTYEEEVLPGFFLSASDVLRSVRRLKRLADRSQATVVAGHDPEQVAALKRAPEYYG